MNKFTHLISNSKNVNREFFLLRGILPEKNSAFTLKNLAKKNKKMARLVAKTFHEQNHENT